MKKPRVLYTYYGDDFTGSTDVLESLALAGIESVLFLGIPTPAQRAAFSHCEAIGIAGDSRSRSPEWMSANLPPVFETLKTFNAPIVQYKTCSTFDSSPTHGSIGRAAEIGRDVLRPEFVPIVVGAPRLGRFVVFANLFAHGSGDVYRIDRHPTMSRHPVTPMKEADLRRHLAAQTAMPVGHIDLLALSSGGAEAALQRALAAGSQAILFDGIDKSTLAATGKLLLAHAKWDPLFAVGSSGLTESMAHAWRRGQGKFPERPAMPVDQVLVVSGSCSPVTESQIRWALGHGFHGVALDAAQLLQGDNGGAAEEALGLLQRGAGVILYTALGPLEEGAAAHGDELGKQLGRLIHCILSRSTVRRVILCGGDTSSHAVQQLGPYALTFAIPLAPGVPLCNAHADDPNLDGLQLVLKGGQLGHQDFFAIARDGAASRQALEK
jgi:3-oxoisoapionate kinase